MIESLALGCSQSWECAGKVDVKPGTTLQDVVDLADKRRGYNPVTNNCVQTRNRITNGVRLDPKPDEIVGHAARGAAAAMQSFVDDVSNGKRVNMDRASKRAGSGVAGSMAESAARNLTGSNPIARGLGSGVDAGCFSAADGKDLGQAGSEAAKAAGSAFKVEWVRDVIKETSKCSFTADVGTSMVCAAPAIADDLNKGKPKKAALRTFVTGHQAVMTTGLCSAAGPAAPLVELGLDLFYKPFHDSLN